MPIVLIAGWQRAIIRLPPPCVCGFARPLKQPWHWLNERFLSIGAFAPFLREAGKKQAAWQKRFYKK